MNDTPFSFYWLATHPRRRLHFVQEPLLKTLALVALALALALPASAAPKKAKVKTTTLGALINIAMTEGTTTYLPQPMVNELGIQDDELSDGKLLLRQFAYRQDICPDNQKHFFNVAYKGSVEPKKLFLLFSVVKGWREGETVHVDGYTLRATLDGKLEKIVAVKGVARQGEPRKLDPSSSEASSVFKHELEFYRKDSANLARSTH